MAASADLDSELSNALSKLYLALPASDESQEAIRLLKIHAGVRSSKSIACTLVTVAVPVDAAHEDYDALSYAHGNPFANGDELNPPDGAHWQAFFGSEDVQAASRVTINGEPVPVSPHLFVALHTLRPDTADRLLWVDALCINLTDPQDRTAQTAHVPDIYAHANQIVVWLGPEKNLPADEDTVKQGAKLLKALSVQQNSSKSAMGRKYGRHLAQILSEVDTDEDDHEDRDDSESSRASKEGSGGPLSQLKPLADILGRTWFERLWPVTEVMNRTKDTAVVHVGNHQLPWSDFVQAAKTFQAHAECCADAMQQLSRSLAHTDTVETIRFALDGIHAMEVLGGEKDLTLHRALRYFHYRECTDPRDWVYALLGLVKGAQRILPRLDYTQPVAEVYKATTAAIIQHAQRLDVFADISPVTGSVEGLPFWAVDWTQMGTQERMVVEDKWSLFHAAAHSRADDVERCTPDTLSLRGTIVDFLDDITEALPGGEEQGDDEDDAAQLLRAARQLEAWEKLADITKTGNDEYVSSGNGAKVTREDAFWRTVLMGVKPFGAGLLGGERAQEGQVDYQAYLIWREWLRVFSSMPARKRPQYLANGNANDVIRAHSQVLLSHCGPDDGDSPARKRFFETQDGYFGLTNATVAEDGDMLCVLAGGAMPFVLRMLTDECGACDADQARCQLLGFAYVHGIMDGEAVQPAEGDDEFGWRQFCLQ